jgi:hypothetical protein
MFSLLDSTLLHLPFPPPLSDFTVLEDAEIESSPVATSALTVRHSNHLSRPQLYLLKNFLLVNFFPFLATQNLDLDHNPISVNLNMKNHLGIIFLFCKSTVNLQ